MDNILKYKVPAKKSFLIMTAVLLLSCGFFVQNILAVTPVIAVTGVTLNENASTLTVGDTDQFTATVTPDTASNKTVTWASDNTAVATVDGTGLVTAVSVGTANIIVTTATTLYGNYTDTAVITVIGPTPTPTPTPPTGGGGGGSYVNPNTYGVGDINDDNTVNEYDFAIMMSQWGQTGTNLSADLNNDGVVDEYDFALLMANWGS